MTAETFSGRGYFWLADKAEGLRPELAMMGDLAIDGDGNIDITLDTHEWSWGKASKSDEELMVQKFDIIGHFKDQNRYLKIDEAFVRSPELNMFHGGFIPKKLRAFACVISEEIFLGTKFDGKIFDLRISLGESWPWLNQPFPKSKTMDDGYEIHYSKNLNQEYEIALGTLTISTALLQSFSGEKRILTVNHDGWLHFKFESPLSIDEAKRLFFDIEDLLILLTDQEFSLPRPKLNNQVSQLYCTRKRPPEKSFSALDCWVMFSDIIDNFGVIVDNWIKLRKTFGSAFYLYLGTRRGSQIFTEHHFVNLIWGLEALHTRSNPATPNPHLDTKIKRILDNIQPALKSRDHAWIKNVLEKQKQFGPTLSSRIKSIIQDIPIVFTEKSLHSFVEICAKRRNRISHSGGPAVRLIVRTMVILLSNYTNYCAP